MLTAFYSENLFKQMPETDQLVIRPTSQWNITVNVNTFISLPQKSPSNELRVFRGLVTWLLWTETLRTKIETLQSDNFAIEFSIPLYVNTLIHVSFELLATLKRQHKLLNEKTFFRRSRESTSWCLLRWDIMAWFASVAAYGL